MVAGHGALGEIELAEEHGPRVLQTGNDGGVVIRGEVEPDTSTASGRDAFREAEILDGNRHTMERPTIAPGHDLGLGLPGLSQRGVRHDYRIRIESGIERVDSSKLSLRHLDWRQF